MVLVVVVVMVVARDVTLLFRGTSLCKTCKTLGFLEGFREEKGQSVHHVFGYPRFLSSSFLLFDPFLLLCPFSSPDGLSSLLIECIFCRIRIDSSLYFSFQKVPQCRPRRRQRRRCDGKGIRERGRGMAAAPLSRQRKKRNGEWTWSPTLFHPLLPTQSIPFFFICHFHIRPLPLKPSVEEFEDCRPRNGLASCENSVLCKFSTPLYVTSGWPGWTYCPALFRFKKASARSARGLFGSLPSLILLIISLARGSTFGLSKIASKFLLELSRSSFVRP